MESSRAVWPGFEPERVARDFLSAEQFALSCGRIWSLDKRCPLATDQAGTPSHGATVYCKKDHLHKLWPALQRRRNRIVLVSSESANAVGPDLEVPPQVAHWFSTNTTNNSIRPLPLGLGNSYCGITAKAPDLAAAVGRAKTKLLYVNFRPDTNPRVRVPLWEHFASAAWGGAVTRESASETVRTYVRDLASHRFALCPRGRGIDTHRLWEALYVGTIPVVQSHAALDSFRDLPILFVDDLLALQRDFLEREYERMRALPWNVEKLFLPYWKNLFEQARRSTGPRIGRGRFAGLLFRAALARAGFAPGHPRPAADLCGPLAPTM